MALLPEVSPHYGKLKFYLNGQWVEPKSKRYFETTNPAIDEVIAEAPVASPEEVEQAIAAAQEAFLKWRDVPLRDRARLVFNLRETFARHHEELARILVQDHGCTIGEGRGTISRCMENIEAAGSACTVCIKGSMWISWLPGLTVTCSGNRWGYF